MSLTSLLQGVPHIQYMVALISCNDLLQLYWNKVKDYSSSGVKPVLARHPYKINIVNAGVQSRILPFKNIYN